MAAKKILFVEGESTPNGNPRKGFEKLLEKKLPGNMPKIILGGGKPTTVKQFLRNKFDGDSFLLVDLDKSEDRKNEDLQDNGIANFSNHVFYMIQELESWFLSQPDILDKYYGVTQNGRKVSSLIPNKKPIEFQDAKGELKKITKLLNKGEEYHEIRHAAKLLALLDASKLENDFPDFKRLIEKLS